VVAVVLLVGCGGRRLCRLLSAAVAVGCSSSGFVSFELFVSANADSKHDKLLDEILSFSKRTEKISMMPLNGSKGRPQATSCLLLPLLPLLAVAVLWCCFGGQFPCA